MANAEKQPSRRTFLKLGLIGGITLAAAGSLYRMTKSANPGGHFILDGEAKAALTAIVPVMLAGAVTPDASSIQAAIARVQQAIAGLPLATQKEIQDLFGLLALAPARRMLAGVSTPWTTAKPAEVAAFLQSWRLHRFAMLQTAYLALHDLIIGPWYGDESTWVSIGYPGPIKELR
jgi:hypothetical protein